MSLWWTPLLLRGDVIRMGEHANESAASAPQEAVDLETAIRRRILPKDPRYQLAAYLFMYEALAYTQKKLGRDDPALEPAARHLTGQELLEGNSF